MHLHIQSLQNGVQCKDVRPYVVGKLEIQQITVIVIKIVQIAS